MVCSKKANPVERQTDFAGEAQEKSKQIRALMEDIQGLEAKTREIRSQPDHAEIDLAKRCWPIDTYCWACEHVRYQLRIGAVLVLVHFERNVQYIEIWNEFKV